jgi:hypothetical protein
MCPIAFQVQTDKIKHNTPTVPDTSLWASSIINSGDILPWHNGHERPHPIPEPVLVTSAPPINTKIIPIVVATANHFKELRKKFTFLKLSSNICNWILLTV